NSPASLNKNITYDTEVLNQALNNVLKRANSKLKNTADSFLKNAQKENFELKLERSIWQHIPVDFGDVWSVAINEIKGKKFKKEPNLDQIIKKIKREHPNLFVDMQNLIHTNKEIQ
ncbi:MAG: DUF2603 domain-containing protein, partial [Campylobacter hyointestinalis]